MNHTLDIFTINNEGGETQYFSNEELFSVSLGTALGVPLWMIIAVFASLANRERRLSFFIPFQIMLINIICPIYFISKNKKMRNNLFGKIQEYFVTVLTSVKMQVTNNVEPAAVLQENNIHAATA